MSTKPKSSGTEIQHSVTLNYGSQLIVMELHGSNTFHLAKSSPDERVFDIIERQVSPKTGFVSMRVVGHASVRYTLISLDGTSNPGPTRSSRVPRLRGSSGTRPSRGTTAKASTRPSRSKSQSRALSR